MKAHSIICNESDYLQAHLTFVAGKPAPGIAVFQELKQQVTSMLKKWLARQLPT